MNKVAVTSSIILGSICIVALVARLIFPEILPVLDDMRIIFYLILSVTIIAILRNVVGLITYGVFGPAIISLGLTIIGDVFLGFVILFSIIAMGLTVRVLLEPLKLQMTHRMAIVVIAVSSTMGILKFIGFTAGNAPLIYASFMPILITSWIVERFMRDKWESGWKTSLTRLIYTLIAVLVSFSLISEKFIMNYFIYTPELWILPVALNILIGARVRVRLSEFFRFRKLAKTNPKKGEGYSQVLTVNIRNREYIEKYNPKKLYPNITKLDMKEALQKNGIPVPKTLAKFKTYKDLRTLKKTIEGLPANKGFVIKPNNSFGGRGISVIKNQNGDIFETVSGKQLTFDDIKQHLQISLDGEFSGRWLPDEAFIEELLVPDHAMAKLSYAGLPDIRVIVFRGVPIMSMTRLPTKVSDGKANLHRGAIGASIDLIAGKITNAVVAYQKDPIMRHPDTSAMLIGETIPFWDQILEMAVRAQQASGLGYVGVDVVIDENKGPLVMEVNKRPGLEIQNANRKPLLKRLQTVEKILANKDQVTAAKGIKIMRSLESEDWEVPSDLLSFSEEET